MGTLGTAGETAVGTEGGGDRPSVMWALAFVACQSCLQLKKQVGA